MFSYSKYHFERFKRNVINQSETARKEALDKIVESGNADELNGFLQLPQNNNSTLKEQDIHVYAFALAISTNNNDFLLSYTRRGNYFYNNEFNCLMEYIQQNNNNDFTQQIFASLIDIAISVPIIKLELSPVINLLTSQYLDAIIKNNATVLELKKPIALLKVLINHPKASDMVASTMVKSTYHGINKANNDKEKQHCAEGFLNLLPENKENLFCILEALLCPTKNVEDQKYITDLAKSVLKRIDNTHAKYEAYQLILEYIATEPNDKLAFILNHPEILDANTTSKNCVDNLIAYLDQESLQCLMGKYIQDQDFIGGKSLSNCINRCDLATQTRFYAAKHIQIPNELLKRISGAHETWDLTELIRTLFARDDYTIDKSEIFYCLQLYFQHSNLNNISALLSDERVFNLVLKYHDLNGDDDISREYRGRLLPMIFAWYAANAKKHPTRYQELYEAQPEKLRKELPKTIVPSVIDVSMPTIRAFLKKLGLDDLSGNHNPRLLTASNSVTSPVTAFMPTLWRNPFVLNSLTNFQKRFAIKYAKTKIPAMNLLPSVSAEARSHAELAAQNCTANFLFHHQTQYNSTENILLDGRIKSTLQLVGHALTGKNHNGYTTFSPDFNYPRLPYTHFTRLGHDAGIDNTPILHTNNDPEKSLTSYILDGERLLACNPQIRFLIVGIYPFFPEKMLTLPDGTKISSTLENLDEHQEQMLVSFDGNRDLNIYRIHTVMLELLFKHYIYPLPEPLRTNMIESLTNPKTESDKKLLNDFLDFIPLEFVLPGSVTLNLASTHQIIINKTTYDLATLHHIATRDEESKVLTAIKDFKKIADMPFVYHALLKIAMRRKQTQVIAHLNSIQLNKSQPAFRTTYLPSSVYEFESLAQLILEDPLNESTYVRYENNKLTTISTLQKFTNRGGAHHAEMAKLQYALGNKSLEGQNAFETDFDDKYTISIEKNSAFPSIESARDALLTFELTTLLTSAQNLEFYKNHQGKIHPKTGKGATNSGVALTKHRLYENDEPYTIKVTTDDRNKKITIETSSKTAIKPIAAAIKKTLNLDVLTNDDGVTLNISAHDLIAKLRQNATFYEGINIINENDGRLLLAKRHNKGLASAGGHHSDKYAKNSVAHGLASEFGLRFRNPSEIDNAVHSIENANTTAKTTIYFIEASRLELTPAASKYPENKTLSFAFKADEDEFELDSETALTLVEMRSKEFYDVMPLAEICAYQLQHLQKHIQHHFAADFDKITFSINTDIQLVPKENGTCKVPNDHFGRIKITVTGELSSPLKDILTANAVNVHGSTYELDVSPYVLTQALQPSVRFTL